METSHKRPFTCVRVYIPSLCIQTMYGIRCSWIISVIFGVWEKTTSRIKPGAQPGSGPPTDARNKSSLSPVPSRHVLSECSLSSLELFSRFPSFRYPYHLVSSQRRSAAPHGCSRVNPSVPCPLVIFYIFGNMVCAWTLAETRSPTSCV